MEIPRPGLVTFLKSSTGYGSIYIRKSATGEDWVYNLDDRVKNETILLQPGSYRVVYRAQNAKQTLYTVNKTFEVKEGSSVQVQLY
jgi:Ca-activated chloride channel family protein